MIMTTASRRRGTPSMPSTRPHQVQDFASRVHGTSTARAHRTMGAWPFLCVRGRPPLSMRVPGRYRSETLKARPPSPCRRGALLYEAAQGSYAHRRSTSLPRNAASRSTRDRRPPPHSGPSTASAVEPVEASVRGAEHRRRHASALVQVLKPNLDARRDFVSYCARRGHALHGCC